MFGTVCNADFMHASELNFAEIGFKDKNLSQTIHGAK